MVIPIFGSNNLKTNIIEFKSLFLFFMFLIFILFIKKLDTYLYIISDLDNFYFKFPHKEIKIKLKVLIKGRFSTAWYQLDSRGGGGYWPTDTAAVREGHQ